MMLSKLTDGCDAAVDPACAISANADEGSTLISIITTSRYAMNLLNLSFIPFPPKLSAVS